VNTLRLELRLFLAERATWFVVLLFGGVLIYGLVNGASVGKAARDDARALEAETLKWNGQVRDVLERQAIDPRQVAGRPTSAVLPPAPLPALAVGQSDLLASHEMILLWRLETPADSRSELENPARLLAGRFDLAFVLVWLLPLFLLAAAYDLCAGDRESGTLRMVLAQGVSPWRWIFLRALARGMPVLGLALGVTLLTALETGVSGVGPRALFAVAVVLAYGMFWLAVAALINGFARSAAAAATAAGAIWVGFVLVVPTLLNVVVESLHPSPSRAELVAESRKASADAERRGSELTTSLYRDHPELAPPGMQMDMMSRMLAVQDEVGRAMAPVQQRFEAAIQSQQRVVDMWRFASPAIAANEALADLAGTGYWRHRAFQEQVAQFKLELHAYYSPMFHRRQPMTKADLAGFPQFSFVEEAPALWKGRVLASLFGILALAALFAGAAVTRMSPRRLAA
jgi:ABC-2 type transport system permease protein